jgi:glyoxylase-like metal-dependent hydrolase (beta-lactamase superfamily II)
MLQIKRFVFNPFQVNTYVVYDETKACVIIDAACSDRSEEEALEQFISDNQLKPVQILNTHNHIDHILGNAFVSEKYSLPVTAHPDGARYMNNAFAHAQSFGLNLTKVSEPTLKIEDGDWISFGNSRLKVLFAPGHADGSVCFYDDKTPFVIAGDVLFYQSIGRTDLPGGDYDLLKESIWSKLFVLPDETIVYPGHGPQTTIGSEKINNPFVAIG